MQVSASSAILVFARRCRDLARQRRYEAREQFDDYVKRVRIFGHPRVANDLRELGKFNDLLQRAIQLTG